MLCCLLTLPVSLLLPLLSPCTADPVPDRLNTVERVLLTAPPAGLQLTIRVRAANLPSRLLSGPDAALPQRWAVVALGHLTGTLETPLNPAYVLTMPSTVSEGLRGAAHGRVPHWYAPSRVPHARNGHTCMLLHVLLRNQHRLTFPVCALVATFTRAAQPCPALANATQPGTTCAAPLTAICANSIAAASPPATRPTASSQGSITAAAAMAPAAPAHTTQEALAAIAAFASQPSSQPSS